MNALQQARTAAGMSQQQAAAILGKTQSHYSKIERGAVALSLRDAGKLCREWNLDPSHLLTTD